MSHKKKNYGLGQAKILKALGEPALSPKGVFMGSLDEMLDVAIPDHRQAPPSDQVLHAKRTEANAVKLAKKTFADSDGPFVDLWAGGLPGMETPWLLYVHPETDEAREDGFRLAPELRELRRAVDKPKVRELYMLLFLSKCRLAKSLKSKLATRIACIAAVQNRGFAKRFSPEPDAAWRDIPMDFLATGKFPRLRELQLKPAQALDRILALASDPSGLGPETTERVYDFTREILQTPTPCGREEMVRMIDHFVRGQTDGPFFTIAGGPGTGKSTIVAAYLRRRKMKGVEYPHFFIDRERGERARTYRVFEHLALCVNPAFVAGRSSPVPVDDRQAEELFQKALQPFTGERKSKRTVIFIDGLDETEAGEYSQSSIAAVLKRLELPPGVRFVMSSRPTRDFRKIAGAFDIDLDDDTSQNEAIRQFYQAQLDEDFLARIDIERIMEKTNRSFLYARLAAKDIFQALSEHESYDVERMPEGLDEYLETEWERATAGPSLDPGAVSQLFAVIAAHRGAPTLDELADFAGITLPQIQDFIGAHEHLFNIEHTPGHALHPATRVNGYWHSEIQRHFVANHIGQTGMRNAHKAILNAYQIRCPNNEWHKGPNDGYYYQNLVHHLAKGAGEEQVHQLLLSYPWIHSRLEKTDIAQLLEDYNACSDESGQYVRRALEISRHILDKDKNQLPGQLFGRLRHGVSIAIDELLEQIQVPHNRPWLCPEALALSSPQGPLVHTLIGQDDLVDHLAITSDGRYLVSASSNGTIVVWASETGAMLRILRADSHYVQDMVLMSDDDTIVTAGSRGELIVWSLHSGESLRTLTGHEGYVDCISAVPDGIHVISTGEDLTLRVWNIAEGAQTGLSSGMPGPITNMITTRDNLVVFTFEDNPGFHMFRLGASGTEQSVVECDWCANDMACLPGGHLVALATDEGNVELWDIDEVKRVRTFSGPEGKSFNSVAISSDGRLVASGAVGGTIIVWDYERGVILAKLTGHWLTVNALLFRPDAKTLVSGGDDCSIKVWQIDQTGAGVHEYASGTCKTLLAITPDGSKAVQACEDNSLRVIDIKSRTELARLRGHSAMVTAIRVFDGGLKLISSSEDRTIRMWDLQQYEELRILEGHTRKILDVDVIADGSLAWSISEDATLRAWNLRRGEEVRRCSQEIDYDSWLSIPSKTSCFALGTWMGNITFHDLLTGKNLRSINPLRLGPIALTPDGTRLVCPDSLDRLSEFDARTGDILRTLGWAARTRGIVVAQNGKYAASISEGGEVRLWNLESGELTATFTADESACSCAVTLDGTKIVVCLESGRLLVLTQE